MTFMHACLLLLAVLLRFQFTARYKCCIMDGAVQPTAAASSGRKIGSCLALTNKKVPTEYLRRRWHAKEQQCHLVVELPAAIAVTGLNNRTNHYGINATMIVTIKIGPFCYMMKHTARTKRLLATALGVHCHRHV